MNQENIKKRKKGGNMKIKFLASGLICLLFSYCATTSQVRSQKPYEELRTYENVTLDHLWKSSKLALGKLGYGIRNANKNEGVIQASWTDKKWPPDSTPPERLFSARYAYLKLSISSMNGKVSLLCEAETRGEPTAERTPRNKQNV